VKIFVQCSSSGGAQEKGKEGMKLSLQPKLVGKTRLGPSYFRFVKFSFPVMRLMPYYAETLGDSRLLIT
jgi:hypothetical protein